MNPSEALYSVPPPVPAGGDRPSPEFLAIDFIDVNRSLTLATQFVHLARLWTHQSQRTEHVHSARTAPDLNSRTSLGGLGAIAGEIDRLLLDCQYLLPRLAEIVDRYANYLRTGSKTPPVEAVHGVTILIDGAAASLGPRAKRDYGGDIAVAAADLTARAVLAAEARRLQLWQEFGRIAQGDAPSGLWQASDPLVTLSFGTVMSLREWLADSAQATVAWLSGQLGIHSM